MSTKPPLIEIYSKDPCPYCVKAKAFLDSKGLAYTEIDLGQHPDQVEVMLQRSGGRRTVPQIFINDHHVGGCDDLLALTPQQLEALL